MEVGARVPGFVTPQLTVITGASSATLTRPNNVTAYVGNGVWGTGADGRFTITAPNAPADMAGNAYYALMLYLLHGTTVPNAAAATMNIFLCNGPFTTVLGDQAQFALNDADITNLAGAVQGQGFPQSTPDPRQLAIGTLAAGGKRYACTQFWSYGAPNGFQVSAPIMLTTPAPGATFGVYLTMNVGYTPLALETMRILALWGYVSKVS